MIRTFRILSAIAFSVVFASLVFGQTADFRSQAALVTEMDVNGIKVILKRRPNSATVAGGVFFRGGARNETPTTSGLQRLTLATAIEAGKSIPRETVRRTLASTGSSIGSSTGYDYSVVSLASTKQDFDTTFDILVKTLTSPAFEQSDIDRNKAQILSGLAESTTVPEGALATLQQGVLYSGHPYQSDPAGTTATIRGFTVDQLRKSHSSIMNRDRIVIIIVGDIDPAVLKFKVADGFGKLPSGNYKETPLPTLDFSKITFDVTSRKLPTNYLEGVFAAPSLADPDYYAMRVAMSILQSLVFNEVRGRLQLSYAPDAELGNNIANTASFSASTVDPNTAGKAMLAQVELLRTRVLDQEAIGQMSYYFLTQYYITLETNAAQAGELARYELTGGGWRRSFDFYNGVTNVKSEDVQRVSDKYMKRIRYFYVGDPNSIDRTVFLPAS